MQPKLSIIALLLLTQTACGLLGRESVSDVCDAYLDCVTAATPAVAGAAVTLYGTESGCWGSSDDADRCSIACQEGLEDLALQFNEVPECGDADVEIEPLSILTERLDWEVSMELASGDCPPSSNDGEATSTPRLGNEFTLGISDMAPNVPFYPLDCTADGQQFTCEDFDLLPIINIEGSTNANLTEVIVSMDVLDLGTVCGVWELILTPR